MKGVTRKVLEAFFKWVCIRFTGLQIYVGSSLCLLTHQTDTLAAEGLPKPPKPRQFQFSALPNRNYDYGLCAQGSLV